MRVIDAADRCFGGTRCDRVQKRLEGPAGVTVLVAHSTAHDSAAGHHRASSPVRLPGGQRACVVSHVADYDGIASQSVKSRGLPHPFRDEMCHIAQSGHAGRRHPGSCTLSARTRAYSDGVTELRFTHETDASRYTLHRGDDLVSVLDYRDDGRTVVMTRAYTVPSYRGHGYAGVVVDKAVAELEAHGDRDVDPGVLVRRRLVRGASRSRGNRPPAAPGLAMEIESAFTYVAVGFEAIGALAMIVGFVIAIVLGIRSLQRGEGGVAAFQVLRTTLGSAILLGLEVLVAADLIRTITSKPSLEDAAILGLIVLIRTVLSMSIQIEIEGSLPWRRALLTSGGKMLGDAVARDRAKSTPTAGPTI